MSDLNKIKFHTFFSVVDDPFYFDTDPEVLCVNTRSGSDLKIDFG